MVLYNGLKNARYLAKYFRMTYDPNFDFGFTPAHIEANKKRPEYNFREIKNLEDFPEQQKTSGPNLKAARWNAFVDCYSEGFRSVLDGMVEGDLGVKLSVASINSVFEKLDLTPIPKSKKKRLFPKKRNKK